MAFPIATPRGCSSHEGESIILIGFSLNISNTYEHNGHTGPFSDTFAFVLFFLLDASCYPLLLFGCA